ncbi:MAG TPA: hypothetical protein P5527_03560, partial [Kiritimatiellia bacterium]|nr:hypothetical protein [Kiritimatiellia bacterium]
LTSGHISLSSREQRRAVPLAHITLYEIMLPAYALPAGIVNGVFRFFDDAIYLPHIKSSGVWVRVLKWEIANSGTERGNK